MTIIADPAKVAPESKKTFEELLQEMGSFSPEDSIIFAEDPITMIGMLMKNGDDVQIEVSGPDTVVRIPEAGVDVIYNGAPSKDTLTAIEEYDPNRKIDTEPDDWDFDDVVVSQDEIDAQQAELEKLMNPDGDNGDDNA